MVFDQNLLKNWPENVLVAIAPENLEPVLARELGQRILAQLGRLFIFECDNPAQDLPLWAANVWLKPQLKEIKSISEGAGILRSIQRNWWLHSTVHHRRANLLKEKLPVFKPKPIGFPSELPTAPLGSWTLLSPTHLLFSDQCTSAFADGEVVFKENKVDPPSRAYLKLWEHFLLTNSWPKPEDQVIDLGSSPGGWTWVLDSLGAKVLSVDKAPLSEATAFSTRVQYLKESAFALDPKKIGRKNWLFCDVICYPSRLLELIQRWQPYVDHMVCSVKFQGENEQTELQPFKQLEGIRLHHLSANKHELTFYF